MPTGILSRRCDCGQIHFFVQDQQTARWLAEQNEKLTSDSELGGEVAQNQVDASLPSPDDPQGHIFISSLEPGYCSRCGDKVIAPTVAPVAGCEMDFPYKRRYISPDPLHAPLPVHPAPPTIEPVDLFDTVETTNQPEPDGTS